MGEQLQGGRPGPQCGLVVFGAFKRQRGEFQHQMTDTGAVAGANGTDPAEHSIRVGQIHDGRLVDVGGRFMVDLSTRSQERMGRNIGGLVGGRILRGHGIGGEFTEARPLPYIVTKFSRQ